MNELENHKIRKRGDYAPIDVVEQAKELTQKQVVKRMVVVVQTEDDIIHRFNTAMDNVELAGLLEATKLFEFCD